MKTKYLDFLNETVDYSEYIIFNELTIHTKQIDLKDLAIEKYKDLTNITIRNCSVLNQETDFSIFKKLERLDCENNQLTTLPDLNKCSQLQWLNCSNNQLTSCKSFYSVYNYNFDISNNPIPQIEVSFVKNKSNIVNYYFDLFNYCVENNISLDEFMEIEWPEDFYDKYYQKMTSPKEIKYIRYLKHEKDFGSSNDDLFNFD